MFVLFQINIFNKVVCACNSCRFYAMVDRLTFCEVLWICLPCCIRTESVHSVGRALKMHCGDNTKYIEFGKKTFKFMQVLEYLNIYIYTLT